MVEVTWTEYTKIRDDIWSKYVNDESKSHAERGELIRSELSKYKVI